ncbi:MAG: saccharopine dehydrogenase [Bacteroidetes bacterium]|jgi:saccharopine dehydrogenase-like NADP-dependent oxidoreductase|nr:saccharopine dehydrogenase [Bacteroidota bacterium]MBT6687158.1 saccharopine dehydrogenase [Bacteroidota bacterium]MBT7142379.1 saccharopine dehydrogenase [Bacteroidota bacterium]MBT7490327.1 saccharopine dehydrogenase [Bacteroidota bacterium]
MKKINNVYETKRKKVAIIGAGKMTKPLVDYFIDKCGYQVFMVNRTVSAAENVIYGRKLGTAVRWSAGEPDALDKVVSQSDIVISMVPKPMHINVAKSCLRCNKNMVTTAYEIPELMALDKEAKEKGLLILNELGEVPGIDHFGTQLLIDEIKKEGGKILSLKSYGSGLPAYEFNNNPMLYKFSWDPNTVFVAAQTAAQYIENGKKVKVPGNKLFTHFWLTEIEGLGTFETYPNKDVEKYIKPFGLPNNITFYRGLLRYSGYCNNLRNIMELGFLDKEKVHDFSNVTYRQLMSTLIGNDSTKDLELNVAKYLNVYDNADIIHRLKWLGLFDDRTIDLKEGTKIDVLLDRMIKRMGYEPHESDMIILHIEVIAEFEDGRKEKRLATMVKKGIPYGDSAMSRAVALPAAISARLILEGKIKATGLRMPPNLPELYKPVLEELETFGYTFKRQSIVIP